MKALHIVSRISDEASGLTYAVPRMCAALAAQQVDVELHVLNPVRPNPDLKLRIIGHTPLPFLQSLGISPSMRKALLAQAAGAEILHNHSLWTMPNVYPAAVARKSGKLLVTSPHGVLSPEARHRSRWKKIPFWHLLQSNVILAAQCLHATGLNELHDIRALGLKLPVSVIPNGIDVPANVKREVSEPGTRTLLYLGRVHPHKNLEMLLRVWKEISPKFPEWRLELAGPDNVGLGYLDALKQLVSAERIPHVRFLGAVFGDEKTRAYSTADLYVLPSLSENFGVTAAEALAHGVPIVITRNAPWDELESRRSGWRVNPAFGQLKEVLTDVGSPGTELEFAL